MSDFQDQFPQDLPRTKKREVTDELVTPPDESMLSADDLLMGVPEPVPAPAQPEKHHDDVDDMILELPPEVLQASQASSDPYEQQLSESVEAYKPADPLGDSLEMSIQYDADEQEAAPSNAGTPRFGVLDQQQLEASDGDSDIVDLGPSTAVQDKPQSFIEKHKPKLVIVAVVLALGGMKFYQDTQKAQLAAAKPPQIDPATTQVQSAAIADLQQGEEYVSPLPVEQGDPAASDGSADAMFGEDLASLPTSPLPPPGNPMEVSPAPQVEQVPEVAPTAPVAPIAPEAPVAAVAPIGEATPAQPVEVPPAADLAQPVAAVQPEVPAQSAGIEPSVPPAAAQDSEEVTRLKAELAQAEARLKEAEAMIAQLKAGAVKAAPAESKPVAKATTAKPQRIVSSAKHQAQSHRTQTSQSVAAKKRSDIQYIGSFLSGSSWGAHVVIAGNLYELSAGQRIANLKVDSVTGSGVTINGVNYR